MAGSYLTVGSGDHHVLAVHGWFGSARGWGSLPDFLDGSAYTYVFMDLRGYGDRKEVRGEHTTEEAAADALAVADELGWDRFSVIGHSMGAKVGPPGAAAGPQPDPQAGRRQPGARRPRCRWTSRAGRCSPARRSNPANRAAIIDFTTGNKLTKTFINRMVQHSLDNSTVEAFAAYLPRGPRMTSPPRSSGGCHRPGQGDRRGATTRPCPPRSMEQTWLVFFPDAELTIMRRTPGTTRCSRPRWRWPPPSRSSWGRR